MFWILNFECCFVSFEKRMLSEKEATAMDQIGRSVQIAVAKMMMKRKRRRQKRRQRKTEKKRRRCPSVNECEWESKVTSRVKSLEKRSKSLHSKIEEEEQKSKCKVEHPDSKEKGNSRIKNSEHEGNLGGDSIYGTIVFGKEWQKWDVRVMFRFWRIFKQNGWSKLW